MAWGDLVGLFRVACVFCAPSGGEETVLEA